MVYFVLVYRLLNFDTLYHLILNTFSNSTIQSQVKLIQVVAKYMILKEMHKENARVTNFYTKFFINYWCDELLLVSKKIILVVGLN